MNKFWTITLAILIAYTSAMRMLNFDLWDGITFPFTDDDGNSCTNSWKKCDGISNNTINCPGVSLIEK